MLWIAISIICLIIEIHSGDFFVCCLAIGGLGGMATALFQAPLWVQLLAWAIISVLSLVFVRPPLLRKFHASSELRTSNADALIGRNGLVTQAIPAQGYGYVKIDGDEWRSVSPSGPIEKGTYVKVTERNSTILTVEPA